MNLVQLSSYIKKHYQKDFLWLIFLMRYDIIEINSLFPYILYLFFGAFLVFVCWSLIYKKTNWIETNEPFNKSIESGTFEREKKLSYKTIT